MKRMDIARFNPIDFLHIAANDISLAQTNLITLRFTETHQVEEIRVAMRNMLTIYPKLRSIVEPTLFSYRMRILNDNDPRLDVLFRDSFRIVPNIKHDSDEYRNYRRNLINEHFAIEQTLPIKMRYSPDESQPTLLISLHHAIANGPGWIHMANSLMAYLNGERPPVMPIDHAHIILPLLEKSFSKIPRQIKRSWKPIKEITKGSILPSTNRPINYFGPVDVVYHTISISFDQVKEKARKSGVSISIIILAAISRAVIERQTIGECDFIVFPVSVALRKYYEGPQLVFGNFLYAFSIRIHRNLWGDMDGLIKEIDTQLRNGTERIERKEILIHMIMAKLISFFGKKYYAMALRYLIRLRALSRTFNLSNIGNMDKLNSYGVKARLCEAISSTPSQSLFVSMCTLNGEIHTVFTFQEAEFTREDIHGFISDFERIIIGINAVS